MPLFIFGMAYNTFAEDETQNSLNTTTNPPQANAMDNTLQQQRIEKVKAFQKAWAVAGQKRNKCPMRIYQAKYQDGNWNCNPNALQNFAIAISNLTQGKVRLICNTIDVGTDQLFYIKPTFIYFTGNKDFFFQESEIKQLKDYCYLGGTVWVDSANPGKSSSFDVAVRREFKKVLPDREFKQVTSNSFWHANRILDSYFKGIGLCPGVEGSIEPIEVITINDELGVIYTLNGYGTMWEVSSNLNNSFEPNEMDVESSRQEKIIDSVKFGFNVVNFLFTRWSRGEFFDR